jgi:hypothetical protein
MQQIEFDFENVGGLRHCYAIPVASFQGTEVDIVTNLHQLRELVSPEDVIAIPMYADDTFSFGEEDDEEDGNKVYDVNIDGIIPKAGLNPLLIEKLSRGEWIVLSEDNNGIIRLSGTKEIPLRCKTTSATGTTYTDRSETAFRFHAVEMQPSLLMEDIDI